MRSKHVLAALVAVLILITATPSPATWSFVLIHKDTKEVGVGTVTCLNNFDLQAIVPVVVVGKGAAAVQAAGDFNGIRRPIIFNGFKDGASPQEMFAELQGISGHQERQYGIVDVLGRSLTFTGFQTLAWAGGVTGETEDYVYAIQGNILTGPCVVSAIEDAIVNTPGDMASKMMAGHIAARDTGGDGRCSCESGPPTSCGCPPPEFEKSGHIGCMVITRIGDGEDPICNFRGCADGDYFMSLNVPFQPSSAPDPVDQLLDLFDMWRMELIGRPDAEQSITTLSRTVLPPGRPGSSTLTIDLRDYQGKPIDAVLQSLTVKHAPGSAGLTTIGPIMGPDGSGQYTVDLYELNADGSVSPPRPGGIDRFLVVADDGVRPVTLTPNPQIKIRQAESTRR